MTSSSAETTEKFLVNFSPLTRLPIAMAESISPQGVDIWLLDLAVLSVADCESYSTILSADELERAQQFKKNQHHFLATRALLRKALSRYTYRSPEQLVFARSLQGKPYLTETSIPLYFNLSHSGNFAALAVSSLGDLGVDIEAARKRPFLKIVDRFFHEDEKQQLNDCEEPEREQLFYRLWTLKEAFFKATGMGISQGLDKAIFNLRDAHIHAQFSSDLNIEQNQWQFHQTQVAPSTLLALALNSSPKVEVHWFNGNLLLGEG